MSQFKITDANYVATVVRVDRLVDLDGLDNLKGFPLFGFQALVSKDIQVGELGVLFTTETQLSEKFCSENNLYAKKELNKDPESKGYLGNNRRVKAIKLRGHVSTALFLPLSSLDYLGVELKEGDTFNVVGNVEVCRKYVIPINPQSGPKNLSKSKKVSRLDVKMFPEHFSTPQYLKMANYFDDDDYVYVTIKYHGTSIRLYNGPVKRKLTKLEKIAQWFGCAVKRSEFDTVAGSRRVIKDAKANDDFEHYYATDVWNATLAKYEHVIPKNYIIYGEILGWVGESQIQNDYTYQIPKGKNELYVYRVAFINVDGIMCDLSWPQVKEFCGKNGLKHVPQIWEGKHKDMPNVELYNNLSFNSEGYDQALPLDEHAPCDEGIVVMKSSIIPTFAKYKFDLFYEHESKQLDSGEVDIESAESEVELVS